MQWNSAWVFMIKGTPLERADINAIHRKIASSTELLEKGVVKRKVDEQLRSRASKGLPPPYCSVARSVLPLVFRMSYSVVVSTVQRPREMGKCIVNQGNGI